MAKRVVGFFLGVVPALFLCGALLGSDRIPGAHWDRAKSPADAGWSVEKLQAAKEFSQTIDTAAVMIVEDGLVIDEWGMTALPLNCHSIRKSLLSALYGQRIADGTIDLTQTLGDLGIDDTAPSLTETEKSARIVDLLKARSGIYHPALYETKSMAAARPERGSHSPDTFWYYNNWDFNAAGSIFEDLTGRSVFEAFDKRLAKPLAMEDFVRNRHTDYVTGRESVHPAYPVQLSTRDLARFGLLYLRKGKWGDRQIVPRSWVRESTTSYSDVGASGGYGYMWWVAVDGRHFPGVTLPEGSFSARGSRGQYLVVIPKWDLVVCHRVNSFLDDTSVDSTQFGRLLGMILTARPAKSGANAVARTAGTGSPDCSARVAGSPPPSGKASPAGQWFDLLLLGGEVIDGTGQPRARADVGIREGKIAAMGDLAGATAERTIEAAGLCIAPGFIDLHSHAEEGLEASDPARRSAPNLITQGITTAVINQDGSGPVSLVAQRKTLDRLGIGLNVAQMLGHGAIRREALGENYRRPASPEEIGLMRGLIRAAMERGAFGLSAGLEYTPGRWSTPAEIEQLVAELAPYRGIYVSHERSSGMRPMWYVPSQDSAIQPTMIDSLQELIDVAMATHVTVVATHIKARGTDFWGASSKMISMIEAARSSGVPVFADQYAYNTSGSDGRIVLIPEWALGPHGEKRRGRASGPQGPPSNPPPEYPSPAELVESALKDAKQAADLRKDIEYEITRRGGAGNIVILDHPDPQIVGKTLSELAERFKTNPVEATIRMQLGGYRSQPGGARVRAFSMSEQDVEAFAATAWTATSSDAGITLPSDGPVHPRLYGAFPRKIRHYAIDRGLMSVEEAVRVSTSLPASILGLTDRGVVKTGAVADLVVFDPARIRDTADAFHPHQYAEGIPFVIVNGQVAVDEGRPLGHLAGDVLQRTPSGSRREARAGKSKASKWGDD